jgi:hypothetical protein
MTRRDLDAPHWDAEILGDLLAHGDIGAVIDG